MLYGRLTVIAGVVLLALKSFMVNAVLTMVLTLCLYLIMKIIFPVRQSYTLKIHNTCRSENPSSLLLLPEPNATIKRP